MASPMPERLQNSPGKKRREKRNETGDQTTGCFRTGHGEVPGKQCCEIFRMEDVFLYMFGHREFCSANFRELVKLP